MLLRELVETSAAVAATRSRTAKTGLVAQALRRAGDEEVETVVAYLSGDVRQRRTGIGWRSLQRVPDPATTPTLTVAEVDRLLGELSALSGPGSQAARRERVAELFGRATEPEQRYLAGLLTGEVRQGALDGLMVESVAAAAQMPPAAVRRAVMLRGEVGPVAAAALRGGTSALEGFGLEVGRPVRPMLAGTAPDVAAAMAAIAGPVGVEWKLDGIRVQVHRAGDRVRVFTRSLDDITDRLPEVVEITRSLAAENLVLDGEAIALASDGRPLPFQQTGSRTASSLDVDQLRLRVPLSTYFFDVLHHDGDDLVDLPAAQRAVRLTQLVPERNRVPRIETSDVDDAQRFFADAVARGHEGVVIKGLAVPYEAGRRGSGWIKVKPRHTLDLVVLAAEWGHGRRQGWLSNLHLGARDPRSGGFVMLGKTFKGLTDAMLTWQTERLLELETSRSGHVVHVRPELVVEVAFDGVQASPRYPAGMALRFARVLRHRDDKAAAEADTVDTVREIHRSG